LKLATMYTVRNQIKGFIPGSPMPGTSKETEDNSGDESDDSVEMLTLRCLRYWQSKALAKIRISIEGNRNKFNLFCQDEMLDQIRCDCRLNHTQISIADTSKKKKRRKQKVRSQRMPKPEPRRGRLVGTQEMQQESREREQMIVLRRPIRR